MKDLHQIVWNFLTSWGSVVVKIGFFFHTVPMLVSALGADGFGVTGLVMVVVGFTIVADLGFRASLGRELSALRAKGDEEGFRGLSAAGLLMFLSIAAPLSALLLLASPWLVGFFQVPDELEADAVFLLRTYGVLHIFTSFVRPVLVAGLSAFKRLDLVNNMETVRQLILWSGLVLGFLVYPPADGALLRWGLVATISEILAYGLFYLAYRRIVYPGSMSFRNARKKELGPLFRLSGYMYVLNLTQGLSEKADPLIISRYFGPAGVALYQAGMKISSAIRPLVTLPAHQLFPFTTEAHVTGNMGKIGDILVHGTKFTFLLGSTACLYVFFFAGDFCLLWLEESLGADHARVARIMRLIALSDFFLYMSGTQWPVLLGMSKIPHLLKIQVPSAVFNVAVSVFIVGYTRIGIEGVLYGTIITGLIRRPLILLYTCKTVGIQPSAYLSKSYARVVLFLLVHGAVGFAFLSRQDISTWVGLTLNVLCMGGVTLATLWFFAFNRPEKEHIVRFFKSRMA